MTTHFPISGVDMSAPLLAVLGLAVGVVGGFFGVGGAFLAGPALFALGLPMPFVIGTDLMHITGKSIAATRGHWRLGHVDAKLGTLMLIGTVPGVEAGAQLVESLEGSGNAERVIGLCYIVALVGITVLIGWESLRTIRRREPREDSPFFRVARRVGDVKLAPMVHFPVVDRTLSLWVVVGFAAVAGFASGLLGAGAGFVRLPMLVYVFGLPTHVAVGTDLFEVAFSAGYGAFSHALKGNVDIVIALVMHTGAALGARFGAILTERFSGARIRLGFASLPLAGAVVMAWKLMADAGG